MRGPRLERMRANPAGDWTIRDVQALCREFDIRCTSPSRGSHWKLPHPSQRDILTIPNRRPVKATYIRKLIAFVEAVQEAIRRD